MQTASRTRAALPVVVALVAALAVLGGCQKRGSGVAMTEERRLPALHAIEVGGAVVLTVRVQADAAATLVQVSGDDDVVPKLKTDVQDGRLIIRNESARTPNLPLALSLTVNSLDEMRISGAAKGAVTGLGGGPLRLRLRGAGDLQLSGRCAHLDVEISGAGHINADKLMAESARVRLSGAGDIDVRTTGKLDADVSGAGSIRYAGPPASVTRRVSGVGSIEPR